jgi:hypothetical protein
VSNNACHLKTIYLDKPMKEGFELAAALIFIFAVGALLYSITHMIRLGTLVIPLLSFAVVTLQVLSQFKGFEWMDSFTGYKNMFNLIKIVLKL